MHTYYVHANYRDKEALIKCIDNEKHEIISAGAIYNLTIRADDMKKAYDIAIQYLPVGSKINHISENEHGYVNRGEAIPF